MTHRQSARRVIIKQGYLKKLPNASKIGSSFKKPDRRWFIFGVMNDTSPYLEYYENEDGIFTDVPINMFVLDTCLYIKRNVPTPRYDNVFTLILKDRHLRLVAQSRSLMLEWCRVVEAKLMQLGIINDTRENTYSALPAHSRRNAPLPDLPSSDEDEQTVPEAPPRVPPPLQPRSTNAENGAPPSYQAEPAPPYEAEQVDDNMHSPLWNPSTPTSPSYDDYNLNMHRHSLAVATPPQPSLNPTPRRQSHLIGSLSSPTSPTMTSPEVFTGPDVPQLMSPTSPTGGSFILPDKQREADSGNQVHGWNVPPPTTDDAPPPYIGRNVLERGANRSLKQSQVEKLKKEIGTTSGVKVTLRKIDCFHAVSLVQIDKRIWIAGWNQQARPFLNNAFHLGDQLVSINGQVLDGTKMAYRLIKNCEMSDKITFIISRAPFAEVYAIRRSVEGESLGIRRNGGTAEIIYVDPGSLVGQAGLQAKTTSIGGDTLCNWWITEINCRPVNLYFNETEIEQRLNAVGKDISIMVQPKDFVMELRKQIKANHKNYKDFILN